MENEWMGLCCSQHMKHLITWLSNLIVMSTSISYQKLLFGYCLDLIPFQFIKRRLDQHPLESISLLRFIIEAITSGHYIASTGDNKSNVLFLFGIFYHVEISINFKSLESDSNMLENYDTSCHLIVNNCCPFHSKWTVTQEGLL